MHVMRLAGEKPPYPSGSAAAVLSPRPRRGD